MEVSVLCSGNGGCTIAFNWAQFGHDVYMFDFEEFSTNNAANSKQKGIHAEGQFEGFA